MPKTLGKNKLIIANVIRARFEKSGLEYPDYFDGSYIEGFEHAVKGISRKDYLAKGISAIQEAARSGKIIAFTIGAKDYADTDMDAERSTTTPSQPRNPDRFTYALALFLICAEKHSYFMFHDGYGVDGGENKEWMNQRAALTKPLPPQKALR